MKKVYLFTGNDFILQERLIELSCVPVPHEPGAVSTFMPDDIAMYQVSDTSLDTVKEYFGANPACTHIFATEEITPLQREFFLQNGIADVIRSIDPEEISAHIGARIGAAAKNTGKLLVYDDKDNSSRIISAISAHFGYTPVFVSSTGDFFRAVSEGNYHFLLLNLGCAGLDVAGFVRGCHACSGIKASPLIAYKDMKSGLFINELVSGINRYISYILSPEELYSFLVDIFFRKELMPLIKRLNTESHFAEFSHFCTDSLSQIYYGAKDKILNLTDITESIGALSASVDEIKKSITKASSLMWMRISPEEETTLEGNYLHNMYFEQTNGAQLPLNK